MKPTFKNLIVIVVVFMAGCSEQKTKTTTTTTTETNADSTVNSSGDVVENTAPGRNTKKQEGYALPGLNHGLCQSPININSQATEAGGKHKITLNYKDEINKVENLGHTVQLDFKEGSTITADDTTFNFKQCHFHTPSEHQIDGTTFPMEMHIVNLMPNKDEKATPQYMVVSVLFKEGKESRFIADFLNAIPKEEKGTADLKAGKVKLADLFGNIPTNLKGHHYYYRGSLTTPPFTESVRWYIAKHVFEASAAQIAAINKIEGNNARHVQAQYGRTVSSN